MNGEHLWLEERPAYTRGKTKTDLPLGADHLYKVEEVYCPETGETYVYETWVCK